MTLVDSSVWIDYLRGAPTPSTAYVRDRLDRDEIKTSEPILMELTAGAASGDQTSRVERLLASQGWCPLDSRLDFRGATAVFQMARAAGHQPRNLIDCLIAAVALRHDVPVAHRDLDFERIAAATGMGSIDLRS